jgi:hypothetical protein
LTAAEVKADACFSVAAALTSKHEEMKRYGQDEQEKTG